MVLILIAGGCGLVASIGISQVMNRQQGGAAAKVEMTRILVAAHDLNIGDKLDAQSLSYEDWPKDRIPEGAITDLEKVKDVVPNTRLFKGEPLLEKKLINSLADSMPPIPEGYRVIPLKVNEANSPPLLLPGDKVDVLGFFRKSNDVRETIAKTFLTDVRVYAVNHQTERVVGEDGKQVNAKTVSVLVTPQQVEKLMIATEMGSIRLSLRGHNDNLDVDLEGTPVDELISNRSESAADKRQLAQAAPTDDTNMGSFGEWLDNQKKQPDVQAAQVTESHGPEKMLAVHTPDGVTLYTWRRTDQLPEVRILSGGGAPAPAPALPPTYSGASQSPASAPAGGVATPPPGPSSSSTPPVDAADSGVRTDNPGADD
jgi:pilus assembly protein CpaB